MFPVGLYNPIPVITSDSSQQPFPLSPIPLSPFPSPFIPTVINIPNI
jgi:hypothetical protein